MLLDYCFALLGEPFANLVLMRGCLSAPRGDDLTIEYHVEHCIQGTSRAERLRTLGIASDLTRDVAPPSEDFVVRPILLHVEAE